MKQLIRKLSRVSDSSSSSYILLRPDASASKRKGRKHSPDDGSFTSASVKRVPEGYLPVVVGEEMERFLVSAECLNHPVFAELLRLSAQEYGYDQKGVLRIPFPAPLFQSILEDLGRPDSGDGVSLHELVFRLGSVEVS